MMAPSGMIWLARHEMRLSFRDVMAMMTAGRRSREIGVFVFVVVAAIFLHFLAWTLAGPSTGEPRRGMDLLVFITAMMVLPFSLMTSQAMESVTRVFYSRSDLDLVLSSPASSRKLFAVRMGAIALSTTLLSLLLAAPLINVLVVTESPAWLAAYPVLISMGLVATVISLTLTMVLFAMIGAKRTRLIAQITAALVGASFIIGIQLAAISSMGTLSRMAFLTSDRLKGSLPDIDSLFWIPARAMTGELLPLILVVATAALFFGLAVTGFSGSFAERVIAASGIAASSASSRTRSRKFVAHSVRSALRQKEWKLLRRDHWLISQTLMQVFYLVPPAFMLWHGYGTNGAVPTVVVPVLVMAAGQLSGGLAWLAISGEDAPQLVATAPVTPGMILRAKIEAVFGALAMTVGPVIAIMALVEIKPALVALVATLCAATSATMIQLWFRSQAKRSNFRRRQTSSRVATFAEAFSSILWAGTAALWAAGSWIALVCVALALLTLVIARALRPAESSEFPG
ncbi:MAG: permease [Nitratireductor sp.]|nr:permease [Nitratireductor sp.]